MLGKETAVLFPLVVVCIELSIRREKSESVSQRIRRASVSVAPYLGVLLLYFAARFAVLRRFQNLALGDWTLSSVMATLPSVCLFYLRQALLPHPLSPAYGVHMASWPPPPAPTLGAIVVVAAASFGAWMVMRRRNTATAAVALLIATLLPAMNLRAFLSERIVHDRYLYVPILCFGILVVPELSRLLRVLPNTWSRRGVAALLIASITLFYVKTARAYSGAWKNEVALWEQATTVDSRSSFTWLQLGTALRLAGRLEESRVAVDKSIAILPNQHGYLERARLSYLSGHYEDAIRDLEYLTTAMTPELSVFELLSGSLQAVGRFDDAVVVLRQARTAHPPYQCRITANLALALFKSGRTNEILGELESVRGHVEKESRLESRRVLTMLGMRYSELGRWQDAVEALSEFLRLTEHSQEPGARGARAHASALLERARNADAAGSGEPLGPNGRLQGQFPRF